jgi:hypothetical protein
MERSEIRGYLAIRWAVPRIALGSIRATMAGNKKPAGGSP